MQSKISDKLKRGSVRMNSSPDLLKSPARKILGDEMNETILKLSMKVSPKVLPNVYCINFSRKLIHK